MSRAIVLAGLFLVVDLWLAGCSHQKTKSGEVAYVAMPQVTLRDRVAAVSNKVTVLKNGDRVEILDHHKLFERVRTNEGLEGWVEKRALVGKEVFDGFAQLAAANSNAVVQARGLARAGLNMHLAPGRATETLYQLKKNESVDVLQRATAIRPLAKALPGQNSPLVETRADITRSSSAKGSKAKPKPAGPDMEDWWLVRDVQGHAGWVYGRLLDFDVPLEIARYAEAKRMVGFFVLNQVQGAGGKNVPQYLALLTEPREGLPYDYDQVRVFTWNTKRERYETAYLEHRLAGVFPARVSTETFDKKEGPVPAFTLRLRTGEGAVVDRKYKMEGVRIHPVEPGQNGLFKGAKAPPRSRG